MSSIPVLDDVFKPKDPTFVEELEDMCGLTWSQVNHSFFL